MYNTDDIRIKEIKELLPPIAVLEKYPISKKATETVYQARDAIHNILTGKDNRLLVIVGPCSIHDTKAALEYAQKLKTLRDEVKDELELIMRVYFEKPRTTVGWKGLINDPFFDESFNLNEGLRIGRKLLLDIANMEVPAATEFLDMITPQYTGDLISWGAIGARTTESQVHRELASGLSCPVGFKNGTDGNIKIALDAIRSANACHYFLSVTKFGHSAIVATEGNPDCHIILRGGQEPNYFSEDVKRVSEELKKVNLPEKVMIDFSHANSCKDFRKQINVAKDIEKQMLNGEKNIFGVMIESNLNEGRQDLNDIEKLNYGQSITDACLGWDDTEKLIRSLAETVKKTTK